MVDRVDNVVVQFKKQHEESIRGLDGGGGPPHDGDMEKRIAQLEALVPTLATKADVEKASHDVTKWVVGTMVGGVGIFIVLMTFVLNNAIPKQQSPQPASSPVIIQVPAQTATPATLAPQPAPPAPTP